jgi:cytochrome P450
MMEAKLALARLIHRFKFSAANGSEKIDIIEKPGLAVQPAPYKVVIQKRK